MWSDRKAPARTTGGAASLGGVGSPWAVLAWAALLVAMLLGVYISGERQDAPRQAVRGVAR